MAKWLVCLSKQLNGHPKSDFTYPSIDADTHESAEQVALQKAKKDFPGYNIEVNSCKQTVK